MKREGLLWKGREEIAKFLFDGDEMKAEKLLLLMESFSAPYVPSNEILNLTMNLPEYSCRWCTDEGECWFSMPDSMFRCDGKCKDFEEIENKE